MFKALTKMVAVGAGALLLIGFLRLNGPMNDPVDSLSKSTLQVDQIDSLQDSSVVLKEVQRKTDSF